jgi:putative spermidine/putrescine transport system permease protein
MSSKQINTLLLTVYALLVVGLPLMGLGNALLSSLGVAGPLARGFTTQYWQQLGAEGGLLSSLLYSLYITLVSLGLSVGIALALVLAGGSTLNRRPFPTLLYVPLLVPSLVMGFYLFQLLSRAGWLSRITYQLGLTNRIEAFPELVQDAAGTGIILAQILMAFPFFTLLFRTLYADARLDELRNLTKTLGASDRQFRQRVAVPVLLRRASPTLVLYGVASMGAYDIPLLLGRTYPQMVSIFVTDRLSRFDLQEIPVGYGAGFVVAVLLMGIIGWLARTAQNYAL